MAMSIELEIGKMTLQEKLRTMEVLWADLSRNDQDIQSPPWHQRVLEEREHRVKSGQENFMSWEDTKDPRAIEIATNSAP